MEKSVKNGLIKSRERINEFGEVFTSDREVKNMLDLVYDETVRIESRFLEPACGDGNFLIEVLKRKIEVVNKKYSKNTSDFESYSFQAITSLYGIDILHDNVVECRNRLKQLLISNYVARRKKKISKDFESSIDFVLSKNIVHGDALTLREVDGSKPIVFSEWSMALSGKVKRTTYTLNNLLAYQPFESGTLFSDLGDEVFLPKPLKEYPLMNFKTISEFDDE